jgi:hypothetical protein
MECDDGLYGDDIATTPWKSSSRCGEMGRAEVGARLVECSCPRGEIAKEIKGKRIKAGIIEGENEDSTRNEITRKQMQDGAEALGTLVRQGREEQEKVVTVQIQTRARLGSKYSRQST